MRSGTTPNIYPSDVPTAAALTQEDLRAWVSKRLGKTQRLSGLRHLRELPRSDIGKVLRRELRDSWY